MKLPLVRRSSYEREKKQIDAAHAAELAALKAQLDLARSNYIGLAADRDRLIARDARLTAELTEVEHELNKAIAEANHWKNQTAAYQAECERLSESETALAESLCELTGQQKYWEGQAAAYKAECERLSISETALTESLNELSERSARWEGEVTAYRAECERLGKQVVDLDHAARAGAEGRELPQLISSMRKNGTRSRLLQSFYLHPTSNTPDRKAIFVLHKTASMLLWRLISKVSEIVNLPLHSPNGTCAEYIPDEVSIASRLEDLANVTGLIGPFRGFVDCDLNLFSRIVAVIRDPRDILVSMYYSWSRSHFIDENRPTLVDAHGRLFNPTVELRQKWIDEGPDPFVLEYAGFVEKNMRLYLEKIASRKGASLLHYEDLIADPETWVRSLLCGLSAKSEDLEQLVPYLMEAFKEDFVTVEEDDPNRHRRQMLPGDHARKLKKPTIKKLNNRFAFYFDAMDQWATRLN